MRMIVPSFLTTLPRPVFRPEFPGNPSLFLLGLFPLGNAAPGGLLGPLPACKRFVPSFAIFLIRTNPDNRHGSPPFSDKDKTARQRPLRQGRRGQWDYFHRALFV